MERPNIILLHSHNTGRHVQPFGHAVPTPHLQRLAQEGVLFRNAFAAAPTCSPSRASFLTGTCAHRAGMLGLATRGWGLSHPEHHIANCLRPAGYHSVLAGVEHTAKNRNRCVDVVGYDQVLTDQQAPADAIDVGNTFVSFLESAPRQPFIASVGLNETHIPFPDPDPENHPAEDARYCQPPSPLPDSDKARQMTAAFKASARQMDDCWGHILDALDRTGLAANTLVLCFSDHGLQFARHMCNLSDRGLGVYLAARGPGGFEGGQVVDSLVSLLDLVPTAMETASLPAPDWLEGTSLTPLVTGQAEAVHSELFGEVTYHSTYEPQRCIRTDRYRYVRRFDDRSRVTLANCDNTLSKEALMAQDWGSQPVCREVLYDLVFDPDEQNNLAAEPALRPVLDSLATRLRDWMVQTQDPLLEGPVLPQPDHRVTDPRADSPGGPTVTSLPFAYLGWD